MKLTVNISPCPNDTFMFDAMLNGRIDTLGLSFDVRFADIEELNRVCMDTDTDVCKASYAVWPEISSRYRVLECGSALGRGNGPLLVSRRGFDPGDPNAGIAVPGLRTTAAMLLRKFFPHFSCRTPVLFSEIAARVASGEFDAGVLIHEGRFTYADKDLRLVADLGVVWEKATGLPLPLGGIFINSRLPRGIMEKFQAVLLNSILHAFENPGDSESFVREHAREMDETVLKNHIKLFVNQFSVGLGAEGTRAVEELTGVRVKTIRDE